MTQLDLAHGLLIQLDVKLGEIQALTLRRMVSGTMAYFIKNTTIY